MGNAWQMWCSNKGRGWLRQKYFKAVYGHVNDRNGKVILYGVELCSLVNLTATGGFLLLWRKSVFWCTLVF